MDCLVGVFKFPVPSIFGIYRRRPMTVFSNRSFLVPHLIPKDTKLFCLSRCHADVLRDRKLCCSATARYERLTAGYKARFRIGTFSATCKIAVSPPGGTCWKVGWVIDRILEKRRFHPARRRVFS